MNEELLRAWEKQSQFLIIYFRFCPMRSEGPTLTATDRWTKNKPLAIHTTTVSMASITTSTSTSLFFIFRGNLMFRLTNFFLQFNKFSVTAILTGSVTSYYWPSIITHTISPWNYSIYTEHIDNTDKMFGKSVSWIFWLINEHIYWDLMILHPHTDVLCVQTLSGQSSVCFHSGCAPMPRVSI